MSEAANSPAMKFAITPDLRIAYEEYGGGAADAVILLHGFPDDPRAWEEVARSVASHGCRAIVPYLRGFGETRFRSPEAFRSGQQAAIGQDVVALMDALGIPRAILAGYDWGCRAACVAAALWPERVRGIIPVAGYTIQDIRGAARPAPPEVEQQFWYQWYFQTERGRRGLEKFRRELSALLWRLWSPNWNSTREEFDRTAASFDNPDFVDIVIHSYRHRCGAAPGGPALESLEQRLADQPSISAPAIVLSGEADPLRPPPRLKDDRKHFTASYELIVVPRAGHFLPHEAPASVSEAVLKLMRTS